jgi:hypothetical protein
LLSFLRRMTPPDWLIWVISVSPLVQEAFQLSGEYC